MPPSASLEAAAPLAVGAGERAALVAEQLGLDQRVGQRADVDGHQRRLGARAGVVDGPRHQLLARAALAADEDRGAAGGRARRGVDGFGHLRVRRLEAGQAVARLELRAQRLGSPRRSARRSSVRATSTSSSSRSMGLVRKSAAPRFIASTALATVPNAVIRITGTSGLIARRLSSSDRPSLPGMRRSVSTRSIVRVDAA